MGNVSAIFLNIEQELLSLYTRIGYKPRNHKEILDFVIDDLILTTKDINIWKDNDDSLLTINTCRDEVAKSYTHWVESKDELDINIDELDPNNFSGLEMLNFKNFHGYTHNYICSFLGLHDKGSDTRDIISENYFWIEKYQMWYLRKADHYDKREQLIAEYLMFNNNIL